MVKGGGTIRRGENIRKRKDGRWEGRYIIEYNLDGKAKYKSIYGHTYNEVKEAIKRATQGNQKNSCTMTVGQIACEWLEGIRVSVKQSTYPKYYDIVYKRIVPQLGHIKIKKLNNALLNKFISSQLENGRLNGKNKGLSAKTVYDIGTILKQILKYARIQGYTEQNFNIIRPRIEEKEYHLLSQEEMNKFQKYLMLSTDYIKLGILIDLLTGLRVGELCALRFCDFDFDRNLFKISRTLQRIKAIDENSPTKTKIIIDSPKSKKSIREIPIPLPVLEKIKTLSFRSPNSYILTGTAKFIEPRIFSDIFKRHLKTAGLPDINIHMIRHSFATLAIRKGADVKDLSEILGHANEAFTICKYVHSNLQSKRECIDHLTFDY